MAASRPDRRLTFAAVLAGTFTVSLSNTALNPAVPALMRGFGVDAVAASWVLTGYLLGMALTMPLTGYLGARFGQARVYRLGLAGFLVASLAGAVSPSMGVMIAARALQGIAAGLMIPLSLALIFAVWPREERGRVTGAWSLSVMLAPALGPVLGGWLLETTTWPALFLVNLPLGFVALLIGARGLPLQPGTGPRPFDWPGFILCVAGSTLLLGASSGVREAAQLLQPVRWLAGLAAVACLLAFIRVELAAQHPLLNLRIFRVPTYWVSVVFVVVQSVGMFGCLLLVPLSMQGVHGFGAADTGLALLATALAMSASGGVGGTLLDRYGARATVGTGMAVSGLATLALGMLPDGAGLLLVIALMAVRGLGLGLCYTPVVTAGLSAVPADGVAEAAAMSNMLRRLVAGVAIVLVSVRFQVHSAQLLALGHAPQAAQGLALREGFFALAAVILLSTPLVWLFPRARPASPEPALRAPAASPIPVLETCPMLIQSEPSASSPPTPAVVALLRSPLRARVEARVVRQLAQALMFEGVLPFTHDDGVFRFAGQGPDGPVTYEARGVAAEAFGLIRLGPEPVRRDAGDGRLEPVDLQTILAEVVAPIGGARLTGFAEELEQTLLKDLQALAQPAPAVLSSRDAYDELEGDVMDAHAVHPCYKSRLGFSLADNARYGPEFKTPVAPEWLAVRGDLASVAWSRDLDPAAFLEAELGARTLNAFADRLAVAGHALQDVVLIPVHPWQWTERVAALVAPELGSGAVVWLGQGPDRYRAQQSIRTLANGDTPQRHALKMSLGIVNTSTSRILARHTALNAPRITDWLRALFAADDVDCVLLGEVAGAGLDHEALGPLRGPRAYGQLSAIWRESVHSHLRPGEAAAPFNALCHVQRGGRPLIADWLDRHGAEAWTAELLRVAVTPIIHLLYAHGVGLESHAQNIVLLHRDGWPTRIALKDFHDGVRYAPQLLARPELAPSLHPIPASHAAINRNSFLETDRADAVRDYSADAFFFVALGELGLFLDRWFGLPERRFWDLAAGVIADYRARHPGHAARIRTFDLEAAATFEVEALTRRRLFGDAEPQVLRVANPLAGRGR